MMILPILLALPDLPDEDRLLRRARRGDRQAIARIYESFFEPVYQFLRWRVSDPALAEDLTSEVFVKFLTALQGENAPRDTLRGWLFRVARNVLTDHYRGAPPTSPLDEAMPFAHDVDLEADTDAALDAERVRRVVGMLAPDQQEVLVLRFGQMMSLQDTADSMGKSVSAIKSLQFRAVEMLRRLLAENEPEATGGLI
ncbi:MAG: sigma-70 family RNA polymerase sigma factor [Anaerolineae bacterium]|nr:sigma-70 family RNA polymerase sigma factor [Anaerolineae bacterium]MEB2289361.1 sigma-70 family RNA polymerase sigma factor [Anaerolineae bacterium]